MSNGLNTHIGLRRSASPRMSCMLWSPPQEAHSSSCCRCSFASVRVVVVVEVMVMNNGHVVEACGRALCTRELESPNVCTKLCNKQDRDSHASCRICHYSTRYWKEFCNGKAASATVSKSVKQEPGIKEKEMTKSSKCWQFAMYGLMAFARRPQSINQSTYT